MANLIQSAKAQVSQLTVQAYEAAVAAGVLPAGVELKGSVEIPKDPQNGDYASSVAMAGAKAMKMAPRAIAQALVDHMDLAGTIFSSGGDRRPRLPELHAWATSGTATCWPRSRRKAPSTGRATRATGKK